MDEPSADHRVKGESGFAFPEGLPKGRLGSTDSFQCMFLIEGFLVEVAPIKRLWLYKYAKFYLIVS